MFVDCRVRNGSAIVGRGVPNPSARLATIMLALAGDGCCLRPPLPPTFLLHPWKYCFRTPPPGSTRCPVVGDRAPGASLPAPSVRGLGGSQTLGMHDVIGGSLGGLLEGIRPRAAKAGRWRWMDGRRGKMLIAIGEVVVASLGDESTPGLGVAAAALSSLA